MTCSQLLINMYWRNILKNTTISSYAISDLEDYTMKHTNELFKVQIVLEYSINPIPGLLSARQKLNR